jgi:hypothetical protein
MEGAAKLFAHYGFSRPVQFHQDLTKQDKLTEWIEYLVFECALHYRYTRFVELQQTVYDKAWKTLAESNILRPFETEEHINNKEGLQHRHSEWQRAVSTLKGARATLERARADSSSRGAQRVSAAQARLDAAEKALEVVLRRSDLIGCFFTTTRDFRIGQDYVKQHGFLLQWILDELPSVEAEVRGSGTARVGDLRGPRKRAYEETADEELPSKRPRSSRRNDVGSERARPSEVLATGPGDLARPPGLDAGRRDQSPRRNESSAAVPPQPLRRSARIAAQQRAQIQPPLRPAAVASRAGRGRDRKTQALPTLSQNAKTTKQAAKRRGRRRVSK